MEWPSTPPTRSSRATVWAKKFVSENREFLVLVAKAAKAKKVLAALRK